MAKLSKEKRILRLARRRGKNYTNREIAKIIGTTPYYTKGILSRHKISAYRKPRKRLVSCLICKKEFNHFFKVFCSPKCFTNFSRPFVECDNCGHLYRKNLSQIKITQHNFHTRDCWRDWVKKKKEERARENQRI